MKERDTEFQGIPSGGPITRYQRLPEGLNVEIALGIHLRSRFHGQVGLHRR